MKSFLKATFITLCVFTTFSLVSQDVTDGFASVSGKGLETTTGGEGGDLIIAETLSHMLRYASSDKPYTIIIKGQFESTNWRQVNVGSNTTIVGHGTDASLKNIGLVMVEKENIIIRNLTIRDSYVEGDWDGKTNDYDGIRADNCHHLWIDHCHLTHLGDGLIDLRKVTDYVTVSHNKLSNHNKAFGIGWTEETDFKITIHHCWIDDTNQRNPSFDMGIGHLYNNYLSNIASYGNLSRGAGRIIVENSHFYKANNPLSISGEAVLYSSNNTFDSCTGNKSGNVSSMPFDPKEHYQYTLDPVDQVQNKVTENAGPQQYVSDQYSIINGVEEVSTQSVDKLLYKVDPLTHLLSLKSAKKVGVVVNVYSLSGQRVFSSNTTVFDTTSVSLKVNKPGIYLLQLVSESKIESGKILLQ